MQHRVQAVAASFADLWGDVGETCAESNRVRGTGSCNRTRLRPSIPAHLANVMRVARGTPLSGNGIGVCRIIALRFRQLQMHRPQRREPSCALGAPEERSPRRRTPAYPARFSLETTLPSAWRVMAVADERGLRLAAARRAPASARDAPRSRYMSRPSARSRCRGSGESATR